MHVATVFSAEGIYFGVIQYENRQNSQEAFKTILGKKRSCRKQYCGCDCLPAPDSFLPQICQERKLIYTAFLKSEGRNGCSKRQLDVPGSQSKPCEKQGQRELLEDKQSRGMGPGLDTKESTAHFITEFCHYFKKCDCVLS